MCEAPATFSPPTRSPLSKMILRAIIDHELKTFEPREGMTFGSDPSCDVVVPHARDRQAFLCVDAEGAYLEAFAAPDVEAGRFPLEIGSVFAIGQTIFDCIEAPVLPRVQEKPVEPIRRACPRCRASLLSVDLSAEEFCANMAAVKPLNKAAIQMARALQVDPSDLAMLASVGEFVLEGLYVNDRLSKYNAKGKTFFKR